MRHQAKGEEKFQEGGGTCESSTFLKTLPLSGTNLEIK
jgi:hypothetical protein